MHRIRVHALPPQPLPIIVDDIKTSHREWHNHKTTMPVRYMQPPAVETAHDCGMTIGHAWSARTPCILGGGCTRKETPGKCALMKSRDTDAGESLMDTLEKGVENQTPYHLLDTNL